MRDMGFAYGPVKELRHVALVQDVQIALDNWRNSKTFGRSKSIQDMGMLVGDLAMSFYAKPRYADRIEVLYPEASSIPGGVDGFTRHHKGVFQEDRSTIEVWTLTPEPLHIPKNVVKKIFYSAYVVHDGLMVASLEGMIVLKLYASDNRRFEYQALGDIGRMLENNPHISTASFDDWSLSEFHLNKLNAIVGRASKKGGLKAMPHLIDTPEEWFRRVMRDLHLVLPSDTEREYSKKEFIAAQKVLRTWFADNLPGTTLNIIGPSDYSGWIEGGPRYLTADLDSQGLAVFNAAWGKDSFWKIETWRFSDWCKRVESANLIVSPARNIRRARWWDTPRGILLLDASTQVVFEHVYPGEKTLSLEDGWWRLQQLFPEFSNHKANSFPCGYFRPGQDSSCTSLLIIDYPGLGVDWDPDAYKENARKMKKLKDALGIPDDLPVEISVGDF